MPPPLTSGPRELAYINISGDPISEDPWGRGVVEKTVSLRDQPYLRDRAFTAFSSWCTEKSVGFAFLTTNGVDRLKPLHMVLVDRWVANTNEIVQKFIDLPAKERERCFNYALRVWPEQLNIIIVVKNQVACPKCHGSKFVDETSGRWVDPNGRNGVSGGINSNRRQRQKRQTPYYRTTTDRIPCPDCDASGTIFEKVRIRIVY